jgi:tRNA threonylcarbamoyl adenosine modification protein YjeE
MTLPLTSPESRIGLSIPLDSPEATDRLAEKLASRLSAGDVLLLEGDIGAGKTRFARALISARLSAEGAPQEEIPSPTFTLVQAYEAGQLAIWHADLYRLTSGSEVVELGLDQAFESALCLVEWPDRLGPLRPPGAVTFHFTPGPSPDSRLLRIDAPLSWSTRLAGLAGGREDSASAFLHASSWGDARRAPLAGDASNRRYERLYRQGGTAVLMDAPPEKGEDVRPFVVIARHLGSLGLSAPKILASDEVDGFLLLEDLGDDLYARVLERTPDREAELYLAAVEALCALREAPDLPDIAPYDSTTMANLAALALDWYARGAGKACDPGARAAFVVEVAAALDFCAPAQRPVLVLRDFHAENLIWLPGRAGPARVGLLDFQDARDGHPAYDLVSLLEDARRDVGEATREAVIRHYSALTGDDPDDLTRAISALGAQRNLRILGVFARLSLHFGKPQYLGLIPRVWSHLCRDLSHPALAPLAEQVGGLLPAPTPQILKGLKDQCGTVPTL